MQTPVMVVHGRFTRHLRAPEATQPPLFPGAYGATLTKLYIGSTPGSVDAASICPARTRGEQSPASVPGGSRIAVRCASSARNTTNASFAPSWIRCSTLKSPLPTTILWGMFGENVFVGNGSSKDAVASSSTLCVGDILGVIATKKRKRKRRTVVLEITSPRRPCHKVDATLGKTPGVGGVRQLCATTGLAGFLCRVVEEGELDDGDKLGVISRPYPQYSLEKVSRLLYGISGAADTPAYKIPGEGTAMTKGTGGGRAAVLNAWKGRRRSCASWRRCRRSRATSGATSLRRSSPRWTASGGVGYSNRDSYSGSRLHRLRSVRSRSRRLFRVCVLEKSCV